MSRETKRTASELAQKQSLPLDAKIQMSNLRIREWYEYWGGDVYVSFSGGKDSTVVLNLVRNLYPDVPAVFVDTGLEYPEIRAFVKTIPNVIILRPEMNFKQVLETYGYPVVSKDVAGTIYYARNGSEWAKNRLRGISNDGQYSRWRASHYAKWEFLQCAPFNIGSRCCDIMKKKPIKKWERETGRKPYLGIMACESARRMQGWLDTGCNSYEGDTQSSKPISFWLEEDVLAYIQERKLSIATVYGDITEGENGRLMTTGVQRTGCMFCAFGAHLEKEPNRFQKMKQTHPKQYAYCMKSIADGGLGFGNVLDYMRIPKE